MEFQLNTLDKSILNLDRHLAESAFRNIDILVGNVSIGSFRQTYANGYIFGKVKRYQFQQATTNCISRKNISMNLYRDKSPLIPDLHSISRLVSPMVTLEILP